jgi:hypothetical protein
MSSILQLLKSEKQLVTDFIKHFSSDEKKRLKQYIMNINYKQKALNFLCDKISSFYKLNFKNECLDIGSYIYEILFKSLVQCHSELIQYDKYDFLLFVSALDYKLLISYIKNDDEKNAVSLLCSLLSQYFSQKTSLNIDFDQTMCRTGGKFIYIFIKTILMNLPNKN